MAGAGQGRGREWGRDRGKTGAWRRVGGRSGKERDPSRHFFPFFSDNDPSYISLLASADFLLVSPPLAPCNKTLPLYSSFLRIQGTLSSRTSKRRQYSCFLFMY